MLVFCVLEFVRNFRVIRKL